MNPNRFKVEQRGRLCTVVNVQTGVELPTPIPQAAADSVAALLNRSFR